MKLLTSLALALVAANPVAAQCTYDFCATGITYPTAIVNPEDPVADQAPCALIPLGILSGQVSEEDCAQLPTLEYVCCPPAGPIACGNTTVDFCPNGMEDPNRVVNPTDPVEDQAPCAFIVASLALGLVPDEECGGVPFAESICCPASNVTMPPTDPDQTPGDNVCYFCGSDVPFNTEKTMGDEPCTQFNDLVSNLPGGEFCDSFISDLIADEGINFQSYCECEGVAAPDLCTVCPDDMMVDADKLIPDADGLTCAEGVEFVKHVTEASQCGEYVNDAARAVCCIAKDDPTAAPVAAPTANEGSKEESSGMSLTMSGLASGLLLVLAFAI